MATSRKLTSVLQDVRKLRRSIRLRGESDPEVVAATLETIMKEAILLRSYNSGSLGRGAVNELRNVRRDLVAGNVNSGKRTSEFVGKYSAILDQIEQIELDTQDDEGSVGKSITSSIAQNLPSADALTAALMTANPVLGYTTKIARDLLRARSESKSNLRAKQDERIAQLNKEQAEAEAHLEELQQEGSPAEQIHELSGKLDNIRDELINLSRIWGDDRESQVEQVEQSEETNSQLEKLTDIEDERNKREKSEKNLEELRDRESEFEKDSKGLEDPLTKNGEKGLGLDISNLGMFSGLGGAIGGTVSKILGGILSPIRSVFRILMVVGASFAKAAAIGTLIISAVKGIMGFFDGLFNAAEILGLDEGESVSILDRLRAAQAGAIAGILAPINWILNKFGLGFADDEEELRGKVLDMQTGIFEFFSNFTENISKIFSLEFLDDIVPGLASLATNVNTVIMGFIDDFAEAMFGISITDAIQSVRDSFKGVVDGITEKFKEMFTGMFDWVNEQYESLKSGFRKSVDTVSGYVDNATEKGKEFWKDTTESFKNFLGFGNDESSSTREQIEEMSEKPSDRLSSSTRLFNEAEAAQSRNGGGNTVIAPNNVTNVRNTTVSVSTGARNNDRSLAHANYRNSGLSYGW